MSSRSVTNKRYTTPFCKTREGNNIDFYDGKRSVNKFGAGDSFYIHNFMRKDRDRTFCKILDEVDFVQMFSFVKTKKDDPEEKKVLPIPRLVSAQTCKGGNTAIYRMPGCNQRNINTEQWTPTVKEICRRASAEVGQEFNHCVCTLYRDKDDSLAYHHDKLLDLEDNSLILSISFGDPRPIQFQQVNGKKNQTIVLQPGSLLAIGPKTNKQFMHAIPKLTDDVGPRVSLSIRSIKTFITDDEKIVGKGEEFQTKNYPFTTSYDDHSEYSDSIQMQIAEYTQVSEERLAALRESLRVEE